MKKRRKRLRKNLMKFLRKMKKVDFSYFPLLLYKKHNLCAFFFFGCSMIKNELFFLFFVFCNEFFVLRSKELMSILNDSFPIGNSICFRTWRAVTIIHRTYFYGVTRGS